MTTRTVNRRTRQVEAELHGEVAPELVVAAAKAWRRMADRISPVIAEELGIGKELVEAYGNPFKEKQGPHLRLLLALLIATELKPRLEQRADVFAPLDFIEAQLGRKVIDIPRANSSNAHSSRAERIALAMVEVTQFLLAVSGEPERLTAEQRLRVHQELQEALAALEALAREFGPKDPQRPVVLPGGKLS